MSTGPLTLPMFFVALWSSALLALGAWTLDRTLRRLRYQTRFVWLGAMLLGLLLVIATPWRMLASLNAAGGGSGAADAIGASGTAAPILVAPLMDGLAAGIAALAQMVLAWFPAGAGDVVRTLWIASAALAAMFLVAGYGINRAIVLRAPRTTIGEVQVRVSEAFGPAVIGVREAEIVVPRWLLARPLEEQQLVVAHERSHIAARDPLLLCVGAALTVLTAWNPLTWWAFGRLRLATELDCDARVLRGGVAARTYGSLLLDLTAALPRPRLGAPAFSARPSQLEERLRAMTTRSVGPVRRRAMLLGAALITVLAVVGACTANVDSPLAPKRADDAAMKLEDEQKVYFDFQTEKPAAPLSVSGFPRYPTELRAAGVEGEVLVQFIVMPDGKIAIPSFRVLKSSAPEFEQAVRDALPAIRFAPAMVKGEPVAQLVQQPFVFQLSK